MRDTHLAYPCHHQGVELGPNSNNICSWGSIAGMSIQVDISSMLSVVGWCWCLAAGAGFVVVVLVFVLSFVFCLFVCVCCWGQKSADLRDVTNEKAGNSFERQIRCPSSSFLGLFYGVPTLLIQHMEVLINHACYPTYKLGLNGHPLMEWTCWKIRLRLDGFHSSTSDNSRVPIWQWKWWKVECVSVLLTVGYDNKQ